MGLAKRDDHRASVHLTFTQIEQLRGEVRKTNIYTVASNGVLGQVRWFAAWRRYVFAPFGGTVFDPICMKRIADFCEAKTEEHRELRKRRQV